MTVSKLYVSSVSGSFGCHNDDDTHRALVAAQSVLKPEQESDAFAAFLAMVNDEAHDAILAELWESAQRAADIALTDGWDNPGDVHCELALED